VVPEDFTWQPESPSRRALSIRVAVVLACAWIGIIAGSYYPIHNSYDGV